MPLYDLAIYLYHQDANYLFDRAVPVAGVDLEGQGIGALLGRDVLRDCLLVYDGRAGTFAISF